MIKWPNFRRPDCVIALRTKRFSHIENKSFLYDNCDVPVAIAIDRVTGQKVTFASAHVDGFSLENPTKEGSENGDRQCLMIAQKMNELARDCDVQILGADMNARPETENCSRFIYLQKQGFELFRTNKPTNVKPDSPLIERELDYIFVRKNMEERKKVEGIFAKIKAFFFETIDPKVEVLNNHFLGFDPEKHASDHLPIFTRITLATREFGFSRLFKQAIRCFSMRWVFQG